jgi:MFS transporter, NRE family, putaive nickel resistance protein
MPPRPVHRTLEIFGVLRDREIRAVWVADVISDAGSFVTFVALAVYVHSLTTGATAVGVALGLRSVAGFLFGPFSGVIADRLDRRMVMVGCNLARAALVAALPFTHEVWQAYVLAFASAMLSPLFRAARAALIPQVAPGPKLVPALTVAETTHHVLHMVGPALGGLVVLLVGARNGFFVDAATFVLSAAVLSTVAARGRPEREPTPALKEFWEGLRTVAMTPPVRTYALINSAVAFSGAGIVALLVLYVQNVLGREGGQFGLVLAVAGLATVACSLVIATRDDRHSRTPWAFASALSGFVFLFALLHPSFGFLLAMGLVLGLMDGGIDVPQSATNAEALADRLRGRATAAYQGFGELWFASGSIAFAWLAEPGRLGVEGSMALAGVTGAVLALAVLAAGGARALATWEQRRLGRHGRFAPAAIASSPKHVGKEDPHA